MKVLLNITNEQDKLIKPFLPSRYFCSDGSLTIPANDDYDYLICLDGDAARTCALDRVYPSETGEAYYTTEPIPPEYKG